MRTKLFFSTLILSAVGVIMCGCSSYYLQSVKGQLAVFSAQQPIVETLRNQAQTLSEQEIKKLKKILKIRNFASKNLKLPENNSYTEYANLHRPYVVWNVMASPEFSLESTEWCYPVVGCAVYRGYFQQQDAEEFAAEIRQQGFDVTVVGVPAYSTLGWFDDPVLHATLQWPMTQIAGLIFHELAHAQTYISGDSAFNESFATTIEIEGVKRWLTSTNNTQDWQAFELRKTRQQDFVEFVMHYRGKLEELYKKQATKTEKRIQKQGIFAKMQRSYKKLKSDWSGFQGYDKWMSQPLNNARMNTVATYHQHVSAFTQLLAKHNGDLTKFYRAVEDLADTDEKQRAEKLLQLE
jgi:predicted aminopeptidase